MPTTDADLLKPTDATSGLVALTQQLAERAAHARPMRASMERAYRTLIDREMQRLRNALPPR